MMEEAVPLHRLLAFKNREGGRGQVGRGWVTYGVVTVSGISAPG